MTTNECTTYSGCVAFYLRLYERPTFLQRNLRKVLTAHSKAVHRGTKLKAPGKMEPTDHHLITLPASDPSAKLWNKADIKRLLDEASNSDVQPILEIDVTRLADRETKFRDGELGNEPTVSTSKSTSASCALTIWDAQEKTLVEQTRFCKIVPSVRTGQVRHAEVKLDTPFLVPIGSLKTKARPPGAGEITYTAQFVLSSFDEKTKWPPFDLQIPKAKKSQMHDQGSVFVRAPLLVAKWTRLPYLPETEAESLIEVKALQDDHLYKPKLRLKFHAQWVDSDSPLTKYNAELRQEKPFPKPAAPLEAGLRKVKVRTEWIFKGIVEYMPKVVVNGYICPLCHGKRFREAGEYHFHLFHNHPLFKFDYSTRSEINASGQAIVRGMVQVEIADSHHALVESESRNLTWIKPRQPLDLEAYLKGDTAWTDPETKRASPQPVSEETKLEDAYLQEPSHGEQLRDQSNRREPKYSRKRAIEDIPNVILAKKRRFKVPAAPKGFQYYRNASKILLEEGDEMSESDDDIAEDWLLQRHDDTIDSYTDTLPEEKVFIQRLDRHMLSEDPSSDVLSEEAMIRFVRRNRNWLRQPAMKLELVKRLTTLKINRMLGNTVLLACLAVVNDESTPIEPISPVLTNEARRSGLRRDGEVRRAFHQEGNHVYGKCGDCWEFIYDKRELQYCINSTCEWKSYHIECAHGSQTSSRQLKWTCSACGPHRNGIDAVLAMEPSLKARSQQVISDTGIKGGSKGHKSISELTETTSKAQETMEKMATKGSPSALARGIPSHLRSPGNPDHQLPSEGQQSRLPSRTNGQANGSSVSPTKVRNVMSVSNLTTKTTTMTTITTNKQKPSGSKKARKIKRIVIDSDGEPWSNSSAENDPRNVDNADVSANTDEEIENIDSE